MLEIVTTGPKVQPAPMVLNVVIFERDIHKLFNALREMGCEYLSHRFTDTLATDQIEVEVQVVHPSDLFYVGALFQSYCPKY